MALSWAWYNNSRREEGKFFSLLPAPLFLNGLLQFTVDWFILVRHDAFPGYARPQMSRPIDEIWHRERHRKLHAALEELLVDYVDHHPDETGLPEIHVLLRWSHEQTLDAMPLPVKPIEWIEWMRKGKTDASRT